MSNEDNIQKQENTGKISLTSSFKFFFWEAVLFSAAIILGITTAFKLNQILKFERITLTPTSSLQFIFYFILSTLFIVIITYSQKLKRERGFILKVIFIFLSFFGGMITLGLWLPDILALILIIALILSWLKFSLVLIHNLIIILSIAGLGSSLGLRLDPLMVVGFLIIFSIYDFIAVYKTKHMVKMARAMIATGSAIALICPQRISDFMSSLKEVKPGGKFLILGGGDVVFPLVLSSSLVPQGISDALIVAVFSLFGLGLSFLIFITQPFSSHDNGRQPIPALPPIALFSIIGFLITIIF